MGKRTKLELSESERVSLIFLLQVKNAEVAMLQARIKELEYMVESLGGRL